MGLLVAESAFDFVDAVQARLDDGAVGGGLVDLPRVGVVDPAGFPDERVGHVLR
jgi:hypothetical protein